MLSRLDLVSKCLQGRAMAGPARFGFLSLSK